MNQIQKLRAHQRTYNTLSTDFCGPGIVVVSVEIDYQEGTALKKRLRYNYCQYELSKNLETKNCLLRFLENILTSRYLQCPEPQYLIME